MSFFRPARAVLLLLLMLIGIYRPALGFDKAGHERIEAMVYAKLQAAGAMFGGISGTQILEDLVHDGYLRKENGVYAIRSASPDLSLERQFLQDRQMYHFMAPMEDVKAAASAATLTARQHALLVKALPRCLALMYVLYSEMLTSSPVGGSQAGRGIYVLMHIVADSYSREHAPRTVDGKIITVKSWQLFQKDSKWPAAALEEVPAPVCQHTTLAMLHRGASDNADKEWHEVNGDVGSPSFAARDAIVDLLVMVHRAKHNPAQTDPLWQKYVETHFSPLDGTVSGNKFSFAGAPADEVQFSFGPEVANNKVNIWDFERYQRWYLGAVGQTGFSRAYGYGVELGLLHSPGRSDRPGVVQSFLSQTSKGWVVSLTKLHTRHHFEPQPWWKTVQAQAQFAAQWTLPRHELLLQARLGAGFVPYPITHRTSLVAGFDFARAVGNDFLPFGVNTTFHPALGYEYDSSGLPAKHTLCLRIGVQTWQNRIPRKLKPKKAQAIPSYLKY